VETVLHHLIRGSGLTGLSGIAEVRGNLIRPLLVFDRSETRAYCAEHGLPFHDDPANADISLARARIRHRILPEIMAINPAAEEAISRLAGHVASEDRFLNGVAAAALESAELPLNGELSFLTKDMEVAFRRERLSSLPEVVIRRAIRLAVEALGAQFDSHETAIFMATLKEGSSGSVTAMGGQVVVELDAEKVHVRQIEESPAFRGTIAVPGDTVRPDQGWRLTTRLADPSGEAAKRSALCVEMPKEILKGELFFRNTAPADRMQPLGFSGHRKLSDLLSEARLTQGARTRLPVICDLIGPIWIPGICLDQRVSTTGGSGPVMALTFGCA
jgi:tRNA(Ile)-lysidine synthase